MHYFQWNIKSYRADTAHLSNEEDLAYRRLIEHYYDTEQPIPTALPPLCRRLRLGLPEVETVLSEFFEHTENGWLHAYCDSEIAKYRQYLERQKANGSKGGRGNKADAKPDKPTALPDKPTAKPTTNHKPLTTNQQPIEGSRTSALMDNFDLFWQAYPKKTGKEAAKKAWMKMKPKLDDCLKALEWQKQSEQWLKDRGQYIPNPATWINQGRWEDRPVDADVAQSNGKPWFIGGWSLIVQKGVEKGIVETRDLYGPSLKEAVFRAWEITPEMIRKAKIDFENK